MIRANSLISKFMVLNPFSQSPTLVGPASRMFSKVPDQVNKHSPKSETNKDQIEKVPKSGKTETHKDQIEKPSESEAPKGQVEKVPNSGKTETHKDQIEKPPKSEAPKGQVEKLPKSSPLKEEIKKSADSTQNMKDQSKTVHNAAKKSLGQDEHDDHHKAATIPKDQTPPSRLKFSTLSAPSDNMFNASGEAVEMEPPRYSQFVAKRNQMLRLLSPKLVQISAKKDEIMDLWSTKTNFAEIHYVLGEAAAIVNGSIVQDTENKSLQSLTSTPNPTDGQSNH